MTMTSIMVKIYIFGNPRLKITADILIKLTIQIKFESCSVKGIFRFKATGEN